MATDPMLKAAPPIRARSLRRVMWMPPGSRHRSGPDQTSGRVGPCKKSIWTLANLGAIHPPVDGVWHDPRPSEARQQGPPRAVEEPEIDAVGSVGRLSHPAADRGGEDHPECEPDTSHDDDTCTHWGNSSRK